MKSRPRFARVFALSVLLGGHGPATGAAEGLSVDPTRPPSSAPGKQAGEKSAQTRTLQSILIAPGRSVAVVDGEMVRVGSRLGDAEVVRIDASGVVLRSDGRTETLKLLSDSKKVVTRTSRHNTNEERVK